MQVVPNIIETVEGRNVTVMCNVTSNPKPGAPIWKKSDGILSSARTFVSEGNHTILNITKKKKKTTAPTCVLRQIPEVPNHRQFTFVSIQLSDTAPKVC